MHKPSQLHFGQNQNRLFVFIFGIIITLGGAGYATYNVIAHSSWQDTPITGKVDTGKWCSTGKSTGNGSIYSYEYEIQGVQYSNETCVVGSSTVTTISYNPNNPSESLTNQATVFTVLGVMAAVVGVVLILGAIFAKDAQLSRIIR